MKSTYVESARYVKTKKNCKSSVMKFGIVKAT